MAQTFLRSCLHKSCALACIWLIESFERRYAFWLIQRTPLRETYHMIRTLHNTLLSSVLESVWLGMRWKRWRTKEKQTSCEDGIRIWLRVRGVSWQYHQAMSLLQSLVFVKKKQNKKALRSLDSPHLNTKLKQCWVNIFSVFPQGYAAVVLYFILIETQTLRAQQLLKSGNLGIFRASGQKSRDILHSIRQTWEVVRCYASFPKQHITHSWTL